MSRNLRPGKQKRFHAGHGSHNPSRLLREPRKLIASVVVIFIILQIFMIVSARLGYIPAKTTKVTAQATASGTVSLEIQSPCSITLRQGWNLISLCANVSNFSINSVLSGTGFRFVLQWNESAQNFDIFSSAASSNQFTEFQANKSYFVFMDSGNSTLTLSGSEHGSMNISLFPGWNAPSYPYQFSANISKYLNPIPSLRFLLKWNSTTQGYDTFSKLAAVNPFDRIYSGEGQLVHSTAAANLSYNKTELQNS